jgi:hypothetical protein
LKGVGFSHDRVTDWSLAASVLVAAGFNGSLLIQNQAMQILTPLQYAILTDSDRACLTNLGESEKFFVFRSLRQVAERWLCPNRHNSDCHTSKTEFALA